jgi:hypothetical protein
MLSQLCSDENVAAVEQWEATRLFAAQERREDTMWRETVVQELRTSRKAFKQLNLHKVSLFNESVVFALLLFCRKLREWQRSACRCSTVSCFSLFLFLFL